MSFELKGNARAAFDLDGRIMVLGGPGSGKTTLSLLKTQRIISNLDVGQQVLFLSFSRAAVRQVLNRCRDVLTADERSRIAVQTYHAFCMDILRAHSRLFTGKPAQILFPDREKVAKAKHSGEWAEERDRLANEDGIYAFDSFAGGASRLVADIPKVAQLIADRFPVIILDEFQDTSDSQWALVQALAQRSELIILADPDQRIFEYNDNVDSERLNHVRQHLAPVEFDLGSDNHRSPDAGILQFADAVLQNRALPVTGDVVLRTAYQRAFEGTVHANILWLYSELKKKGISRPSIAVLARANTLVSDISGWISTERTYNGIKLKALSHDVMWDAELAAAAAQIIASILEWPEQDAIKGAAVTLDAVADFFEVKSAVSNTPIASALSTRDSYRRNAAALRQGADVRPRGAIHLVESSANGVLLVGDPRVDWLMARNILEGAHGLSEIAQAARFVRLFGATDEIGRRLSEQWDRLGNYGGAMHLVRRALDQGRLITEQREPQGFVLMNIHKSKGKEFDGVILVEGRHRGVFFNERDEVPHWPARRLLRVAITRARHKVIIIRPVNASPLTNP